MAILSIYLWRKHLSHIIINKAAFQWKKSFETSFLPRNRRGWQLNKIFQAVAIIIILVSRISSLLALVISYHLLMMRSVRISLVWDQVSITNHSNSWESLKESVTESHSIFCKVVNTTYFLGVHAMKHLWLAGCLKYDSYKRNVWLCDFHKDTLIAPKMYRGRHGVASMLQLVFSNLQTFWIFWFWDQHVWGVFWKCFICKYPNANIATKTFPFLYQSIHWSYFC